MKTFPQSRIRIILGVVVSLGAACGNAQRIGTAEPEKDGHADAGADDHVYETELSQAAAPARCEIVWEYSPPKGRTLRFAGVVDELGNTHGLECDGEVGSAHCEHVSWTSTGTVRYRNDVGSAVFRMMRLGQFIIVARHPFVVEGRDAESGELVWTQDVGWALSGNTPPAGPRARITSLAARGNDVLVAISGNDPRSVGLADGAMVVLDSASGEPRYVVMLPYSTGPEPDVNPYNTPAHLVVDARGSIWATMRAPYDGAALAINIEGAAEMAGETARSTCVPQYTMAKTDRVLLDPAAEGLGIRLVMPENLRSGAKSSTPGACGTHTRLRHFIIVSDRVIGLGDYQNGRLVSHRIDSEFVANIPPEDLWNGAPHPIEWAAVPSSEISASTLVTELIATAQGTFIFVVGNGPQPGLFEHEVATGRETFSCSLASGAHYAQTPVTLTDGIVILPIVDSPGGTHVLLRAVRLPGRTEALSGWTARDGSMARAFQERPRQAH